MVLRCGWSVEYTRWCRDGYKRAQIDEVKHIAYTKHVNSIRANSKKLREYNQV